MLEDSVKRRENWRIKNRCERSILTSMGMVRFQHTRFAHKRTNETKYLLDLIMGLAARARLSGDAKARILKEAVQSSYEKAGQCLPEDVSKETVMRIVRSLDLSHLPEDKPKEKCQAETLYVETDDEDHIALQFHEKKGDLKRWKGHGDNGQIVKLVYVHEGKVQKEKRLCRVLGQEEMEGEFWGWIKPREESGAVGEGKGEIVRGKGRRESREGVGLSERELGRGPGPRKGGRNEYRKQYGEACEPDFVRVDEQPSHGLGLEPQRGGKKEAVQEEKGNQYLSVREILNWEKRTRKQNGKYIEAFQARVGRQIGAKVYFQAAIAGIC